MKEALLDIISQFKRLFGFVGSTNAFRRIMQRCEPVFQQIEAIVGKGGNLSFPKSFREPQAGYQEVNKQDD